jgi:hypothetical protein
MRRPVCPLEKALYGRPDAGGYWEQHCDQHLKNCEFDPVAPDDKSLCSCYYSKMLNCYMIACVDDSKIAGLLGGVKEAWRLIRAPNPRTGEKGLVKNNPAPAGKFLGRKHACGGGHRLVEIKLLAILAPVEIKSPLTSLIVKLSAAQLEVSLPEHSL